MVQPKLGKEYAGLERIIDGVDRNMDKTQDNLDSANKKLKDVVESVSKGANCCFEIFLLLALAACIYFVCVRFIL